MGIFRIYAGEDGRSHLEDHEPSLRSDLARVWPTTGVFFREFPVGTFMDWHPAPRRQIVIILSGRLEHVLGDGRVQRFGPGDLRIMADMTGQGHTTRVLGDEPVLVAVVPLAD
jgi:hypothetical protein